MPCLFYVVIQIFIELLFLFLFFQVLNFKMIIFIYCREEGETGNAGEQPASNTLYGYTAKEMVSTFFFLFFCRLPIWLRKPKVEYQLNQ